MNKTIFILVEIKEFKLIKKYNFKKFPSVAYKHDIFSATLNQEFACNVAQEWSSFNDGIKFVLSFQVDEKYIDNYQLVENLELFNNLIIGKITMIKMYQKWYVYLLRCEKDDTLYCGITNNLDKRVKAHNSGNGAKYTKTRMPVSVLKFWVVDSKSIALKREYQIKQLSRAQKLALI
ncbi:GIY-YIG_UPF0213 domain containing protein [uncultured Caudovirales phage]|uniref:GIY-YIG_UPF0213 domain containing protein n=1 Tax=uncultured Caudovirales phage TaxID=2100421 RepID=A0A6J5RX43_9CAUD|nr:GIY-YIG_UPF0213 domain containing protein [uncultured Caudovirales phage]